MKDWFRRHALHRPSGSAEAPAAEVDESPRSDTEAVVPAPDVPEDLWERCPQCRELLYARELQRNLQVCQKCGHHGRLTAAERIEQLTDPGTWHELDANLIASDPIGFVRPGRESYSAKLTEEIAAYNQRTSRVQPETDSRSVASSAAPLLREAAVYGTTEVAGNAVVLAVLDSYFFAATMGTVVGEKVARAAELASRLGQPLVAVSASGGARQDEGIFALLQMAKTTAALARLAEARIPYVSVLTDPTLAGVTASFASQADCIIAEPGAVIGFAGPRLIEQIMHEKLPADADTAEFQRAHGMVDMVVARQSLKTTVGRVLRLYLDARLAAADSAATASSMALVGS